MVVEVIVAVLVIDMMLVMLVMVAEVRGGKEARKENCGGGLNKA